MEARLKNHYSNHAKAALQKEFGFDNPHRIPQITKVVVNVGVGEAAKDQKLLQSIVEELGIITGQKPMVNRARKSISNFSLREGMPVGVSVTLRKEKMWFFLDRLIARTKEEMRDSDLVDDAGHVLFNSPVEDVWLLGRRGPVEASFSIAEMREMAELQGGISVVRPEQIPDALPADMDPKEARARRPILEVLQKMKDNQPGTMPRTVHFEFFVRPVEVLGDTRVTGLRVERTKLEDGRAVGTGEIWDIPCGLIITCIGYLSQDVPGLPMDRGIVINTDGRVEDGVYVVGWAKRGPSGTIGTNRPDAQDVVKLVLADLADGAGKDGGAGLDRILSDRSVRVVDFDHWQAIDKAEIERATHPSPRRKFVTIPEMLSVIDEA